MNSLLRSVLGAVILVMLFFAFNSYVYEQEQPDTVPRGNGVYLGHIHALLDNNSALDFDDVTWLTGEEGIAEAITAGLCTEETREECLPNDFIITNDVVRDERVPVDPAVKIYMQTWKMEEAGQVEVREIGIQEFSELINNPELHWRTLPFNVTITDGSVSRIDEVYVP